MARSRTPKRGAFMTPTGRRAPQQILAVKREGIATYQERELKDRRARKSVMELNYFDLATAQSLIPAGCQPLVRPTTFSPGTI
jgi:hypothetical protein